eukprot:Em0023g46a
MGNLLRVLNDKGSTPKIDFFVDFEKAEPTASETEVYEKVNTVLSKAHQILQDLKTYKGAGEQIREMTNPAIQNDFSYYRRTLNRRKMDESQAGGAGPDIPDDVANRMSLFYANPTPMLNTLSGATSKLLQENPSLTLDNMTDCFSTMASVCRVINENPTYASRFQSQDTILFCLRVMVGAMILYDHVHPVGAFAKKAGIDMKASIKVIKENANAESAESLLNALRMAVAFALTGFSLLVRTTALALLELVASRVGLQQDGSTARWVYSRMGLQQDGSTAGWVYSRVGLQQDGSTARWVYSRMGLQQDGSTAGWVYSRMGLQQGLHDFLGERKVSSLNTTVAMSQRMPPDNQNPCHLIIWVPPDNQNPGHLIIWVPPDNQNPCHLIIWVPPDNQNPCHLIIRCHATRSSGF